MKYSSILEELQAQATCDHRGSHSYTPNGNLGGFALFITTCDACGKILTEGEVDESRTEVEYA